MEQLSSKFETFDAVGNREDLQDVIDDITTTENIFMYSIGTGYASEVKQER